MKFKNFHDLLDIFVVVKSSVVEEETAVVVLVVVGHVESF
jgi:hypothetical protein